jgi:hypothetical protein
MVKQRGPGNAGWHRMLAAVSVATAMLGCGTLGDYLPLGNRTPCDDPLLGRPAPDAVGRSRGPTRDRIPPVALPTGTAGEIEGAAGAYPEEALAQPPVLPPAPAKLAVAPRLRGDNPLAIDTPAPKSRRPALGPETGDPRAARDQALAQLRARGANWHELEPVGHQWRLRCTVPDPARGDVSRFYEAYADTDLAAIWAVIEQLDQAGRPPRGIPTTDR